MAGRKQLRQLDDMNIWCVRQRLSPAAALTRHG